MVGRRRRRPLERAVTNLLDNAAKWSPPEGTVLVRLTDGVLTVDDQGPGIAEADLPHVFERFYRAEESRAMPGSGLGLAIVRQVIDRHGGQLQVTEAPGGGARFALWLPGVAAAGVPLPTPGTTPAVGSAVEDAQQPLGLPLRLGPLLGDVGASR